MFQKVIQNFLWDPMFNIYSIIHIYKVQMIFGKTSWHGRILSEWDLNRVHYFCVYFSIFNLKKEITQIIKALYCSQFIPCPDIYHFICHRNYYGPKWPFSFSQLSPLPHSHSRTEPEAPALEIPGKSHHSAENACLYLAEVSSLGEECSWEEVNSILWVFQIFSYLI